MLALCIKEHHKCDSGADVGLSDNTHFDRTSTKQQQKQGCPSAPTLHHMPTEKHRLWLGMLPGQVNLANLTAPLSLFNLEVMFRSVFMWCWVGKVTVTHVADGEYEVQDVRCCKCSISLGWTYLKAFNEVHGCLCVCHRLVATKSLTVELLWVST